MDYRKLIIIGKFGLEKLRDLVKYVQENPDKVKKGVDTAFKILETAKKLGLDTKVVAPLEQAANNAKKVVQGAASAAGEKGSAAVDAGGKAIGGIAGAAAALASKAGVKGDHAASREERKAAAELSKAIADARQVLLEGATAKMTYTKLVDALSGESKAAAAVNLGVLDSPGCFVIATYKKIDLDRDLSDYRGVYVGKDVCVGDGIAQAISRAGNPDVYADVKFKQNVVIYVFACAEDKLDEKCAALINVLGARDSYNMPIEALARTDW